MIQVTLFSRKNCHLCEQALADLNALQEKYPHELTVVDVDEDEKALRAYGLEVPVVQVGPYVKKAPFNRQDLQITLGAASDRAAHIQAAEDAFHEKMIRDGASTVWTTADRFSHWFSNHYVAVLNLIVFIYVGLPVLAPVLMKAGYTGPAQMIYRAYSLACHQLAFRSFFLFGEQPYYPRAAAGVAGVVPYAQATGLDEGDSVDAIYGARNFIGNEAIGYKIALCERDVAIYGAILLFGLIYAATNRRLPALPWYLWLLVGILPIAYDGLSQLFSQPPINLGVYRESSPFMRTLTGALFGFTTAWFGYPMVEQTMAETRQVLEDKRQRIKRWQRSAAD